MIRIIDTIKIISGLGQAKDLSALMICKIIAPKDGFTEGKWRLDSEAFHIHVQLQFIDNKNWLYVDWREEAALIVQKWS